MLFFMLSDFLLEDLLNTLLPQCDLFTAGLFHIYLSSTFLVGLLGSVELLSGRIFQTRTFLVFHQNFLTFELGLVKVKSHLVRKKHSK